MLRIRQATEDDYPDIWPILHEVFAAGETYPHPVDTDESAAREYWMTTPAATFVAEIDGEIVGSYYLRPNQVGLGSHVANAGFVVASKHSGKGIGTALGEHSLKAAKRLGFLALQFNLVVSTNEASLKIWNKLGFTNVGTLPRAFRHAKLGLVDAYIMYRWLDDVDSGANDDHA
jgi:RimJ/RimL family protein N-acetyltransferase